MWQDLTSQHKNLTSRQIYPTSGDRNMPPCWQDSIKIWQVDIINWQLVEKWCYRKHNSISCHLVVCSDQNMRNLYCMPRLCNTFLVMRLSLPKTAAVAQWVRAFARGRFGVRIPAATEDFVKQVVTAALPNARQQVLVSLVLGDDQC